MAQQTLASSPKIAAVAAQKRWTTFTQGLFFVLGFGVFIIGFFGLAGTLLGDVLYDARNIVRFIGGVALIIFGLFTLRVINIPFLYGDTRREMTATGKQVSGVQSFVTGISFAAGWTPCIGPFLGAILSLSVTAGLGTRLALLTGYTLGLGVPFLLFALLFDRLTPLLGLLKRNMRIIEIVSGGLLIVIGLALLTGGVTQLSTYFSGVDFGLEKLVLGDSSLAIVEGAASFTTIFAAVLAGFLSFVSPCVLPLVPAYLGFIGGWAVNNTKSWRRAN